jgi:hypothetical protein
VVSCRTIDIRDVYLGEQFHCLSSRDRFRQMTTTRYSFSHRSSTTYIQIYEYIDSHIRVLLSLFQLYIQTDKFHYLYFRYRASDKGVPLTIPDIDSDIGVPLPIFQILIQAKVFHFLHFR